MLDPGLPLHAFAAELRSLRDSAGQAGTVTETCARAGISRTTYYAWLEGRQRLPRSWIPGRTRSDNQRHARQFSYVEGTG
ncbi:helix-turn-helix domain-containing protein [Nocardia sp. CA-135398]|uniref:helix-turn-helix domain-containing protein n=1 Tax=Nocardia sp. CA-135398 TaxID=3239977 RepID=UPI003D97A853